MNRREEMDKLAVILDTVSPCSEEWSKAYARYCELDRIEQEEYRKENISKLKEFYDKYIANKEWSEIDDEDWSFYSDYHKDVFGYRPRSLNFGEYVPVNHI